MVIFAMLIGRALESATCSCTCSSTFLRDRAHRRLSGAHQHWSPSHSQWLGVSAGAPRLGIAQRALRKARAFGGVLASDGPAQGGARFTAAAGTGCLSVAAAATVLLRPARSRLCCGYAGSRLLWLIGQLTTKALVRCGWLPPQRALKPRVPRGDHVSAPCRQQKTRSCIRNYRRVSSPLRR